MSDNAPARKVELERKLRSEYRLATQEITPAIFTQVNQINHIDGKAAHPSEDINLPEPEYHLHTRTIPSSDGVKMLRNMSFGRWEM